MTVPEVNGANTRDNNPITVKRVKWEPDKGTEWKILQKCLTISIFQDVIEAYVY